MMCMFKQSPSLWKKKKSSFLKSNIQRLDTVLNINLEPPKSQIVFSLLPYAFVFSLWNLGPKAKKRAFYIGRWAGLRSQRRTSYILPCIYAFICDRLVIQQISTMCLMCAQHWNDRHVMMNRPDVSCFQWNLPSSWGSALGWTLSEADTGTSKCVRFVWRWQI